MRSHYRRAVGRQANPEVIRALSALGLALLACVLLAGCAVRDGARPAKPERPPANGALNAMPKGEIAFEAAEGIGHYSNGRGSIAVISTDGTRLRVVAEGVARERLEHPAWTPDGTTLAFHDGAYHWGTGWLATHSLWTVRADGSQRLRCAELPEGCLWPAWSPDGTRIAFSLYSSKATEMHIAVARADGSGMTELTTGRTFDTFPEWTPDGRIMFLRKPHMKTKLPGDLFVIGADGTDLTRLTDSGAVGGFALSPDGTQIAYHDARADKIKVMSGDGEDARVLVDRDFGWIMAALSWAPDGDALAIGCSSLEAASGDHIYVVGSDGAGLAEIPGLPSGLDPAWRPE